MKRTSIIERRKDIALTQQEVAEKAGISRSYYAMIESGYKQPTLKTWLRIGDAINLNKIEIFELIISSEEQNNEQ